MKKNFFDALLWMAVLSLAGCQAVSASASLSSSAASAASSQSGSVAASSHAESLSKASESTSLEEMMTALAGYQPGTAGSSLKQYVAACGVLNFAQQYDDSQAERLRSELEGYLAAADKETLTVITGGREDIDFAARNILSEGVDSVAELLDEAGDPNQHDVYDPEKYEAVARILKEALAAYA